MNKSIFLKVEKMNEAVIELTKKLGISGSFSQDDSYVDLYTLLQVYLLDLKKREKINEILGDNDFAKLLLTEKEMNKKEFHIPLDNSIEQSISNNIDHYLKLKFQYFEKIDFERVKKEIFNKILNIENPKILIISQIKKNKILIKIDKQEYLLKFKD